MSRPRESSLQDAQPRCRRSNRARSRRRTPPTPLRRLVTSALRCSIWRCCSRTWLRRAKSLCSNVARRSRAASSSAANESRSSTRRASRRPAGIVPPRSCSMRPRERLRISVASSALTCSKASTWRWGSLFKSSPGTSDLRRPPRLAPAPPVTRFVPGPLVQTSRVSPQKGIRKHPVANEPFWNHRPEPALGAQAAVEIPVAVRTAGRVVGLIQLGEQTLRKDRSGVPIPVLVVVSQHLVPKSSVSATIR